MNQVVGRSDIVYFVAALASFGLVYLTLSQIVFIGSSIPIAILFVVAGIQLVRPSGWGPPAMILLVILLQTPAMEIEGMRIVRLVRAPAPPDILLAMALVAYTISHYRYAETRVRRRPAEKGKPAPGKEAAQTSLANGEPGRRVPVAELLAGFGPIPVWTLLGLILMIYFFANRQGEDNALDRLLGVIWIGGAALLFLRVAALYATRINLKAQEAELALNSVVAEELKRELDSVAKRGRGR